MGLIKFFIIILVALGFINSFVRSDFINIIVPTLILVIFYTSLNKNVSFYLKTFLYAIIATILYDLIWFLSSGSVNIFLIFSHMHQVINLKIIRTAQLDF